MAGQGGEDEGGGVWLSRVGRGRVGEQVDGGSEWGRGRVGEQVDGGSEWGRGSAPISARHSSSRVEVTNIQKCEAALHAVFQ